MLIWITVAFTSAILGIWFACKLMFGSKNQNLQKNVTLMLIGIALCTTSLMTLADADVVTIRGAEHIANIYIDSSDSLTPIFYDDKTDEYFTIKYNLFNIANLTDRHILDPNKAQEFIDTYNRLSNIDLFN